MIGCPKITFSATSASLTVAWQQRTETRFWCQPPFRTAVQRLPSSAPCCSGLGCCAGDSGRANQDCLPNTKRARSICFAPFLSFGSAGAFYGSVNYHGGRRAAAGQRIVTLVE